MRAVLKPNYEMRSSTTELEQYSIERQNTAL